MSVRNRKKFLIQLRTDTRSVPTVVVGLIMNENMRLVIHLISRRTSFACAEYIRAKNSRYSRYFVTKHPVCQTVIGSYSPRFDATLVATVVLQSYTAAVSQNTHAV